MITHIGRAKLVSDIAALKAELERTIEERSKAAAEGDLRENSAYIFLTERSQVLHTQISELEDQLKQEKIAPLPTQTTVVEFGHLVTVKFLTDSRVLTVTLVGKHDSRIKPDWISVESPLGLAILGKRISNVVDVNGQQVVILDIKIGEL